MSRSRTVLLVHGLWRVVHRLRDWGHRAEPFGYAAVAELTWRARRSMPPCHRR